MGRVWQILLFVGLLFWVFLLGPGPVAGAEEGVGDPRPDRHGVPLGDLHRRLLRELAHLGPAHPLLDDRVLALVAGAPVGRGLLRVFATAVVASDLHQPGPDRAASANRAIIAETIVFLFGGILGTLHHLYWTGTPTSVIAVGSVFSALEVVPLTLIGLEALQTYRRSKAVPWLGAYKWVILSFVAVGFWNTVGAGLLGFAINPAGVAVLRAGPEHDGRARSRRAVRRLRHAGHRADAVLPARSLRSGAARRQVPEARLLEPEHRPGDDGLPVAAAGRASTRPGQHHQGPVVRAFARHHSTRR
jgi:hypothetical protein